MNQKASMASPQLAVARRPFVIAPRALLTSAGGDISHDAYFIGDNRSLPPTMTLRQ
jgi:hypothetical protein